MKTGCKGELCWELTEDSNGRRLSQEEAIGTDEDRNLSERVDLLELSSGSTGDSFDELEFKVIGLCYNTARRNAWVVLDVVFGSASELHCSQQNKQEGTVRML